LDFSKAFKQGFSDLLSCPPKGDRWCVKILSPPAATMTSPGTSTLEDLPN
jgi:hypothetical protein